MLDERIRRGEIDEAEVRAAALQLARFFAGLPPVEIAPAEYRARLERGVASDRHELSRPELGLPPQRIASIAEAQLAFLAQRADLFDERVRKGRIVEGHGDLRPEHICLVTPPAIIDCLEFAQELRIGDPTDELSFLGLECERLGKPAVGQWFLDAYREVTRDEPPAELLRFHRRYRALRRAVIAVWHLRDPMYRNPEPWLATARHYLDLAAR